MTQLNTLFFQGSGKSLWPLADTKSLVEVQDLPIHSLEPGDLIAYCASQETLCHRILAKKQIEDLLWFFVKGDRNLEPDGWIPSYRVLGHVTHLNGRSLQQPPLSHLSTAMYWFSFLQWQVYRALFRPFVSRFFTKYRYHFLSVQNL